MFERIDVLFNDVDQFDKVVKHSLPEGGDLTFITKDEATKERRAAVVATFTVQLPDGTKHRAQAVTTVRNLMLAAAAIRGRYGDDGIVRTFDKVN